MNPNREFSCAHASKLDHTNNHNLQRHTPTHNNLCITMSTTMTQASLDAYAHLARVHAIVVETLPTVRRQCIPR